MIWGAIEAELNGGNATSGAMAAGIGEASAKYLTRVLYNTNNPETLTEEQKKTISDISKVAGGVAAGLSSAATGGNSLSIANSANDGMSIAESAVEHNFLKDKARETLDDLAEIFYKTGKLSANQIKQGLALVKEDRKTNELLYKYQTGQTLSPDEIAYFQLKVQEFTKGYDKDRVVRLDNYFTSPQVFSENSKFLDYLEKHAPVDWQAVSQKLGDAALSVRGARATKGGKPAISYQGQNTSFAVSVPNKISAKDRQITVGDIANYGKQTTNLRVSTGAENVALYPKLKEQLMNENLINIGKLDPKLKEVSDGVGKNLNYGISGISSIDDSNRLGKLWVGEGYSTSYEINSHGQKIPVGLISADGLRGYRFPSEKPNSKWAITGIQANFETYKINPINNNREKIGNAHLNIQEK